MRSLIEQKTRLLLCEDDEALGGLLADFLRRLDFEVDLFGNGEDGLEAFRQRHYDLCLLDINMPQLNGFEVLENIRRAGSEVPVVFLSERKAIEDVIKAYNLGCDDYLTKPCPMDILLCKIHAILRRCHLSRRNNEVEFDLGGVHFDSVRQMLGSLHLSARESDLLLILCRNANQTVERNLILRALWSKESYFASRSLSVYVNHLRKHLAGTGAQIVGIHGRGYKLIINN